MGSRYGGMKCLVMTMGGESPPRHLSRQIADSAKGCPNRTELMYGNTTAAHGERGVHRTALALIRGGCEKRSSLCMCRTVRSVDEVTKRDGVYIIKGYHQT